MRAKKEFVVLMAMMTSLMALAIDAMLPALTQIGEDLNVKDTTNIQYIITVLFLGFGIGQVFFGPASDSVGRKKPILWGGVIFLIGCFISFGAQNLEIMILGRFLQGFGAASFRTISLALIRDKYEGRVMAETMSLVMTVFILVPVFAPALGQLILAFFHWRMIYLSFFILCLVVLVWFYFRQEETLKNSARKKFSTKYLIKSTFEVLTNSTSAFAILISSLVFGGFISYLSTSQQIFQNLYHVGEKFPLYFGALAIIIGLSSFTNSKLVLKFGMTSLIQYALVAMSFSSFIFYLYLRLFHIDVPSLFLLICFFIIFFGSVGLLFGNLNTLALAQLGHIAGIASSVVGSLQSLISVTIGIFIAKSFSTSLIPVIMGFSVLSLSSCFLFMFGVKKKLISYS
jgi:DHA1 family bicyclomycin/chloramphenicol resistance-like MFS transporter